MATNSENILEQEETYEEEKRETKKKPQCTSCGRPVAGHLGRCGKKCILKKIGVQEEDERGEEEEEDEDEPVRPDEEEEDEDETGGADEERKEEDDESGKVTSTPMNSKNVSIPALQFIQEKGTEEVLGMILRQLQRMELRIDKLDKAVENTNTSSVEYVPIYNAGRQGASVLQEALR